MKDRSPADPDNENPGAGNSRAGEYVFSVLEQMPDATAEQIQDIIEVNAGDDEWIVVVVTTEAIELWLPTLNWRRHHPVSASRLWQRVSADELDNRSLQDLIDAALVARQEEFHECRFCGRRVPPEHRFSEDVCHGCASKHFGVVY